MVLTVSRPPKSSAATPAATTPAATTPAATTPPSGAARSARAAATTSAATDVSTTSSSTSLPTSSTARAARLLGGQATTRGAGTPLADGVCIAEGRLLVDGEPAASRALLRRAGGLALMSAARRVCDAKSIAQLSTSARRALVAELAPVLARPSLGRASLGDVRARSGAFSLLEECLLAMRSRDEGKQARALARTLVAAAVAEKNPGLRGHMERRLAALPAHLVSREIAADVEQMAVRQTRARPLGEQWLKGTPPTLRVLSSVMDEFWREELASYREQGYALKEKKAGVVVATKVVDDVEPAATIAVELRCRDSGVFDGLHDDAFDVVLYSGHAQLGGVAKASLADASRAANGTKLVALFSCRSKQSVAALERQHPGQHLLVSDQGTYGHDDRIVQHELLDGIVRGRSYAQIEAAAKKQKLWEPNNYLFPQEAVKKIPEERVFVPESKTAIGRSISLRPRAAPPAASSCPPGPVADTVAWLNTIHGYWAEGAGTPKDKALADHLVSGGWFDGGKKGPIVQLKDVGTKVEISVNSAYAHQDPDALAMMVTFAAGQELAARGDGKRTEHERRMLALAMVSSYAFFLVEYSDTADVLLRQFARTFGFPPGLSWPVVEKAVLADTENDCSKKTIAMLDRGMEHVFLEVNPARTSARFRRYVGAALAELQKSDTKIGQLTHELIATGKVRIDELSDLTRGDYLHVRREFMRTGVELPADHKTLDDKRSKAWRAITTDMNGYMWDDRIYVAEGLSPRELASTLVHEVNHVLNHSEEHYRSVKDIFVEEYRAFYSEALFRGEKLTPERCRKIKEGVIVDYELTGCSPDDLPDVPPGVLDELPRV